MQVERLVLLLIFLFFLLSPAVLAWWSAQNSLWYQPYLLWWALIMATALLQVIGSHDD